MYLSLINLFLIGDGGASESSFHKKKKKKPKPYSDMSAKLLFSNRFRLPWSKKYKVRVTISAFLQNFVEKFLSCKNVYDISN
jgi:hypothetical protein